MKRALLQEDCHILNKLQQHLFYFFFYHSLFILDIPRPVQYCKSLFSYLASCLDSYSGGVQKIEQTIQTQNISSYNKKNIVFHFQPNCYGNSF